MHPYSISAVVCIETSRQTHLLSDLDRVAAPAGKEHPVARLDRRGHDLALLVRRTGADRDHGRLGEGAARRGRRQEDARRGFLSEEDESA